MKAIILARVSSKEQEDNNSIPAQTRRLNEYALRLNLDIISTVQLVESSTKANRTKFNEIISSIKRSKETIALVTDTVDRLQRSFKESVVLDELRKDGKIELHFMREGLVIKENSNSSDLLRWDMGVMFAKSYVTQLSDNVRRSQVEKIRNGEWLSKAPFGYSNVNKSGKVWIEPNEDAQIVISIFQKYSSGDYSMQGVRSWLEDTYSIKKSLSQVAKILGNPFYYGSMKIKGNLYSHTYSSIIGKELYDSAQQVASRFKKTPFKYAGLPYLFRGIIECTTCGCRITPESSKGYIYYHCTQSRGKHGAKWLREEDIDNQLADAIRAIQPTQEQFDEVIDALRKSHEDKISFKAAHTSRIQSELSKITIRLERLFDSYLDQIIDKEIYSSKRLDYEHQKSSLESQLNSLDSANEMYYENATKVMELVKNAPLLFSRSSDPESKRQILNILFQNLEIEGDQLRWKYKKPFNLMASYTNDSSWLRIVDVFQEDSLASDLVSLSTSLRTSPISC